MILEADWQRVCDTIEKFYKNSELVVFSLNDECLCVDIGLYDSPKRNEKNERYYENSHFRSTEVASVNMTKMDLLKVKDELLKRGIIESKVYEIELNTPIYNIGDVVIYEGDNYGKIIDIDKAEKNYPFAVTFPAIYDENEIFWVAKDEIKFAINKEKIQKINECYFENRDEILKVQKDNELEEGLEVE